MFILGGIFVSDSKDRGVVQKSYDNLWSESKRTKSLLKFFSTKDLRNAATGAPSPEEHRKAYSKAQLIGLILGPLLFVLALLFLKSDSLDSSGIFVVAAALWIATWWVTEAIPIPATSLLPLFLFPMGGVMSNQETASFYGDDIVFLFLGGFLLAVAMEKWNLHTRIALSIIKAIGTTTATILLGFMVSTALLSMFVSNTAAVMIMIPIGLAIIKEAHSLSTPELGGDVKLFEKALVLGIGYAGTIGGLGTLIGTPPLIILAGQMRQIFDVELNFAQWMLVGIPVVIVMLAIAWAYMNYFSFKHGMKELPGGRKIITDELEKLGKMTREEVWVLIIFILAAALWIMRGFFFDQFAFTEMLGDGSIAMFAAVLLFLIPSKKQNGRVLDWGVAKDLPWGVLLLFGGGLALAGSIVATGVDAWIGEMLAGVGGMPLILMIAIVAILILFLTEFTSNTATATMILPVLAGLAIALDVHPLALMIPAAMAANCAFMLPVGTPPNAIVFGTNKVSIAEMVKTGVWLNVIASVIIIVVVYLWVPVVYGIDLHVFPF
ncbi:SLC13/DASS family transporter [Jeotgalicoccus nanhaiensis]|uniref:Sodium-dependent dicarboxylate transporter SdcS n=1 Tax=Jeotgalicoccus nanhaiensis TaxID=568603 RepID=A0ABR9XVT5_9STAP|nr:SLC13/DASS family transporter [Jeotgalicoccus nanhaiensis]TFU62303.1 SLC13/DASS family transporter [Jeotgalicoccus nanhaiensis]